MVFPIDKVYITQRFGENPNCYKKYGMKGHNGIDFRTRFSDSPLGHRYVVSALEGVVEQVRYDKGGYGTHIRIRHDDGALTIYGHLKKSYVRVGQYVAEGELIGLTGNTGDSTGPHLHFELRPSGWEDNTKNGYAGAVDPLPYLEGKHEIDIEFSKHWEGSMIMDVDDMGKVFYIHDLERLYIPSELSKYLVEKGVVTGFKHKDVIRIKEK